jgi:squalene-hopene/tetraprenyl-beta-curcumene cyclase
MRFGLLLATASLWGWAVCAQEPLVKREYNYSLRNEALLAIDKGLDWLKDHQNPQGTWGESSLTLQTGLTLTAFLRHPAHKYETEPRPEFLEKGLDYFREGLRRNNSISRDGDVDDACVVLRILEASNLPNKTSMATNIRKWISMELAAGVGVFKMNGEPLPVGFVSRARGNATLERTFRLSEALYLSAPDADARDPKKNPYVAAAIAKLSPFQDFLNTKPHMPKSDDNGGFACDSDGTRVISKPWTQSDHACGLSTYTGVLSLIFGGVKPSDLRVAAAFDWIGRHYTLQENPAMGQEGYYRYLHRMAEALPLAKIHDLKLSDGRKIDWAREETIKVMDLQNTDGSWVNKESREWMEDDPIFATSLMVRTLELLYYEL